MRVLVTGARGFVGKNLVVRLRARSDCEVIEFTRDDAIGSLSQAVGRAEAIVHLAGENRPSDPAEFECGNAALTRALCDAIKESGRRIPLVFASSIQAELNNPYGISKRAAEAAVEGLVAETMNPCIIYRLPNIFGKWCRPNYNSVVATFCSNLANGLPIQINDPMVSLRLVYVDDVVDSFIESIYSAQDSLGRKSASPEYSITLGDLAAQIRAFDNCRSSLVSERVGSGLARALYATYVSYLPKARFLYDVPKYKDQRGTFVEMLKTLDSGQFSFFTAHPGVTRGGHYHHTKTEKFLVIKGVARFCFRHILTNESYELHTSGDVPQVVETIPGWTHDITNIGSDELFVMLWANEIFDRERPDTVVCKV